ncbi:MAG TPA: hypothetical protein VJ922_05185 [Actinomycetota bacterium]|nr:hypothetical protein [Actinomycetota bacterium]
MVPAATLKVFEPLSAFDGDERAYWEAYAAGGEPLPPRTVLLDRETGLEGATATLVAEREHAELVERRGVTFVCPHRTKLRLLASILAFRRSIPAEVVRAFMPEDEVERAEEEIESLRNTHPDWRNHILESAWEVPLHWFAAFDDAERQLIQNADGSLGLRYETLLRAARERVARVLAIVRDSLPNPGVIAPLAGLVRWLEEFNDVGLLALDYADVARLMSPETLEADRTCRDIWASVRALSEGDGERASAYYMTAAERWSAVRRRETWN